MKRAATVLGSAVLVSGVAFGHALAADLILVDPVVDPASPGVISYSLGAAVGGLHNVYGGNGIVANQGPGASATRWSLSLDGSLGYTAESFGFLVDGKGTVYGDEGNGDDDWTRYHADVTGHFLYSPGEAFLIGVFIGAGVHEDTGDSDENMNYWFDGIEASAGMGWGNLFGQVGYLDSVDEYDEGTKKAPFIRVGATYFLDDNFAITGAASFVGGIKLDDVDLPNRISGLEIEPEYKFADSPISVFARYEFNEISYDDAGIRRGDTFHAFKVGLRIRSDGTLRDNLSGAGSLSSPMAGPWVAFNANEIEQ